MWYCVGCCYFIIVIVISFAKVYYWDLIWSGNTLRPAYTSCIEIHHIMITSILTDIVLKFLGAPCVMLANNIFLLYILHCIICSCICIGGRCQFQFVLLIVVVILEILTANNVLCVVSYLQPPAAWVHAQLESRELMFICLKKLKGLNKVSKGDYWLCNLKPHIYVCCSFDAR